MPRNRSVRLGSAAIVAAMLSVGGLARAEEFPVPKVDFSADMVTHMSGFAPPPAPGGPPGGQPPPAVPTEISGKMYQSGGNTRQEINTMGILATTITRRDKKVVWTLLPMNNSYMEFSFDDAATGKKGDGIDNFWKSPDTKIEKLGKEDVNGVETTHDKVTITAKDGQAHTGEVWLTKDNIPMRMKTAPSAGHEVMMELKNLKIGKQDASLFEVPAGYQKTQMPNFSGLMGGAGAPGAGAPDAAPGGAPAPAARPQLTPEQLQQLKDQMRKQLEQMQKNMPQQPPSQTPPPAPPSTP